jgi:hypothetical protein
MGLSQERDTALLDSKYAVVLMDEKDTRQGEFVSILFDTM